jgi:hypothetical protein
MPEVMLPILVGGAQLLAPKRGHFGLAERWTCPFVRKLKDMSVFPTEVSTDTDTKGIEHETIVIKTGHCVLEGGRNFATPTSTEDC